MATETLQKFAACFLAGVIADFELGKRKPRDRVGRPRKMRTLDREMLADTVDWIAAAYHKNGSKAPVKEALAEVARFEWEERHPGAKAPMTLSRQWLATVKRYNLEGLAGLVRRDRAFAREAPAA
jgi:hypothetical protein